MAKARKLLKSLEAAGWAVVARREGHVQLRHPERSERLTLPAAKLTLPGEPARLLGEFAGLRAKAGE